MMDVTEGTSEKYILFEYTFIKYSPKSAQVLPSNSKSTQLFNRFTNLLEF